jgi:formamidopyrimidine-DNA glycosylase
MPELPEVETIRRGLEASLKGAVIKKLEVRRGDLRIPFPKDLAKKLAGRTIIAIERRAKYLLFYFDSEDVLIVHLGMTGNFSIESELPQTLESHDHVIFHIADGRYVIFNDPRRFGLMTLAKKDALDAHPLFLALGPDPFSEAFSATYLKAALARRKGPIKPALMDQHLVAGVGNIYASEALFLAKIDPRRRACDVASKASLIIKSVRAVLADAIASGGSSLRDFLHLTGESGHFQHRFNVYGREGEPCFRCGAPVQIIRQAGRATFFCKRCQH